MFFIIGVGYLDCNTVFLAVTFLTLESAFTAAARAGSQTARVDAAPRSESFIVFPLAGSK